MVFRWLEKFGAGGVIVASMGCAACFPALGALGSAIGLGFLASFEGILINKLLPMLAGFALVMNLILWWQHRNFLRGTVSLLGPIALLATLYPLWKYGWSTYLFYAGLVLMLLVSLFDVYKPARPLQCQQ